MSAARYPSLEGRAVLITGGGSGIGESLVEHFCGQGARVAFLELDPDTAASSAQAITERTGNRPVFETCDLRDVERTQAAVQGLARQTGPFRVLVNNAGNDDRHPMAEVTSAYWDDRFAVNVKHQFFCAQAVAEPMAEAGGGAIVNLGSISWMMGAAGLIAYTTAKSAIMGLTKSLARELGPKGIRVNSIAPGMIWTSKQIERARADDPAKFDRYLDRQCLKEHLGPADVARLALWLAGDDSRLVTAQTFIVDAGVV